jgi:hypothetical protein
MKYVQIGILACLVVIAGLLIGIYQGQRSPDAEQVATAPISLAEAPPVATTAVTTPTETEVAPPPEIAEAKPSPLPAKTANRRPQAVPQRKEEIAPPEPAAGSSEAEAEAEANSETADWEPASMPPPVTEPVIPNLPPLVDMPEPVPPPQQQLVMVPEGSEIVVRMINTLSTNRNLPGDSFEATLEQPLIVDGWLVAPKGSRVEGRVLESKKAGRVKGVAELSFDLVRLTTADGKNVDIATAPFGEAGEKSRNEDLKKIGWGAGIGAVIGAIAGGGKGAAIGAGAGAGAGAGTVLATRGETVVVPTETRLTFRLTESLQVTSTKPVTL